MKKAFTVEGTEYTVEDITAIATCAGEYGEDFRQNGLQFVEKVIKFQKKVVDK